MRDYETFSIIQKKSIEYQKFKHKEITALDKVYHRRYQLQEAEYQQKWLPIQQNLFDPNATWLPNMVFLPDLEHFFMLPDCIAITRRQLTRLKRCMRALGEKEFVIIENERLFQKIIAPNDPKANITRFKYPSTLTYTQFLDGGTDVIFELGGRLDYLAFFVFGESGQWGLYSLGTDEKYDYATYILGFRKEVAPLFIEHFKDFNTEEEKKYILDTCFPHMPAYQQYDQYLR